MPAMQATIHSRLLFILNTWRIIKQINECNPDKLSIW